MRKHIKLLLALALALTVLAGFSVLASAEESTVHTHQYELTQSVMPGCETGGYFVYTCKACGDTYTQTVSAIGHKWSTQEKVVAAATCGSSGYKMVSIVCSHCGAIKSSSMVEIPATGAHNYVTSQQEATCTQNGYYRMVCSVCGDVLMNNVIDAYGHSFVVTNETPATCTSSGSRTLTWTLCGQTQTLAIPMTAHNWTSAITQPATCSSSGVRTYTCTNCGTSRTESIPATGQHTFGPWVFASAATCTAQGTATQTCTVCGYSVTRSIPALGHSWSDWVVVKPATCTSSGTSQRACSACGETQTQSIPAIGHTWTQWTVTSPATSEHTGLYQRTCTSCGEVETQIIPKVGLQDTLCAFGLRLKDVGNYLDPSYSTWYMFTPFDASVEGMQTYELVVNDAYIVGTCTLTILNGEVSFTYNLNSPGIQMEEEFFTILNKMTDLHEYEPEKLMDKYAMKTNTPYSISQQFGGDTNLVLYMCCRVRFEYDASMTDLNYTSTYHTALVNVMTSMLDK